MGVFAVPEVDFSRTISNHPTEIFEVLGIEAARASIFNELRGVISFDGNNCFCLFLSPNPL